MKKKEVSLDSLELGDKFSFPGSSDVYVVSAYSKCSGVEFLFM